MRLNAKLSFVLVVLLAVVWTLQAPAALAGTNKPVKVDVKCPKTEDAKFSITVDPFEVEVAVGQGVEWKLGTDNSKNEDIRVSAKDEDDWLYTDITAKGKKTVVMTQMVDGAANNTYDYEITVYCGDNDKVVLDPRIRVGGG
jgi:hypothetical protein